MVADNAAREVREYPGPARTGEHLTDQLPLPTALAGSGSFTAANLNMPARPNMEVISGFLPVRFRSKDADRHVKVVIEKC